MVRPSGPSGSVLGKTIAMLGKETEACGLSVSQVHSGRQSHHLSAPRRRSGLKKGSYLSKAHPWRDWRSAF